MLFLKSDAYFVTLCGARDTSLRRVRGMTNMAKNVKPRVTNLRSSQAEG